MPINVTWWFQNIDTDFHLNFQTKSSKSKQVFSIAWICTVSITDTYRHLESLTVLFALELTTSVCEFREQKKKKRRRQAAERIKRIHKSSSSLWLEKRHESAILKPKHDNIHSTVPFSWRKCGIVPCKDVHAELWLSCFTINASQLSAHWCHSYFFRPCPSNSLSPPLVYSSLRSLTMQQCRQ